MKETLLLGLLLMNLSVWATVKSVLFIGNSYTYVNDLPNLLRQVSTAMGDTITVDSNAPGGYTLQQHCTNSTTLTKIAQGGWDFVIIQEQSQKPSFPPSQVEAEVYPYAKTLDSLIHVASPCAETVFYMTWGRKNGDASNCGFYPVICTFEGMQSRLRESYLQMAMDNNATVAPVGMAWKRIRDTEPQIELYNADESHPVETGSYLTACVLYSSLFHKPSNTCPYTYTLADSIAHKLQLASDVVVFDSLTQWQQNGGLTFAGFDYAVSGSTVGFNQLCLNATTYSWDFGDGATANGATVQHTYAQNGQYIVSLTATNNCHSSTVTDTVEINSLTGLTEEGYHAAYVYPTNFTDIFHVHSNVSGLSLELYNISGQLLLKRDLDEGISTIETPSLTAQPLYYRLANQQQTLKTGLLQKLR